MPIDASAQSMAAESAGIATTPAALAALAQTRKQQTAANQQAKFLALYRVAAANFTRQTNRPLPETPVDPMAAFMALRAWVKCIPGYRHANSMEAEAMGNLDYQPDTEGDPTLAPPGSREKIAVLAARVEAGLVLWHPADRSDYDGCTSAAPTRVCGTPRGPKVPTAALRRQSRRGSNLPQI